jgi:hypothetical protein
LYFPLATYALVTLPGKWELSHATVMEGISLGIAWQLIPLGLVGLQRALRPG